MLTSLLFLITGIIGFITMTIILLKHKKSIVVNKYFIIIFTISSIRLLLRGIEYFNKKNSLQECIFYFEFLFIFSVPFLYLYFKDLIAYKKWNYKQFFHFIPLTISIIIYFSDIYIIKLPQYVFDNIFRLILITFSIYIYQIYKLLVAQVFSRKSDVFIINKQNKLIKNWLIFLFTCFVLLFIRILILFLFKSFQFSIVSNYDYFWVSALIWLIIFLKILITPELLYGYDLLQEKINDYKNANIALDNVWVLNLTPIITNIKDLKTQEKVNINLKNYIFQIENLSFYSDNFRDPELTLDTLAKKLNIPTFHLSYIFKYHSTISFVDYKKVIRIQDAVKLIENNFLKSNTYESLAKEVGFKSYMPFYSSFKNITGLSPQEFYKKFNT
jgi:AraC-like DNA-binding protein